ncbi:serine palmitoyltransferase 1 [Condylostylus longicornis]|uniref:serine palmitoyltransferase 1 n=1 Tax=Condylostylus longicornis TaxID=2530218 RepID=UPI00244E56FC|nr:serine palmitoyltransferase 1 [Condylostylus longicornis]
MLTVSHLIEEILKIYHATPEYAILQAVFILLISAYLIFMKNQKRKKKFTREEEEAIIANYTPEPLVPEIPEDHPKLHPKLVLSKIGKIINLNGHSCIDLATHNYLSLIGDKEIEEKAIKSIKKYGIGSCGPRGFYGTVDVHLELEQRLADFMKMEEAILYSYGFSTIASAIPAYSKKSDVIFADEQVNFAIQKGIEASRSVAYFYKHNDMEDLERLLVEQSKREIKNPKKAAKTKKFLIAEGIYMNTGEICPLPELIELRKKYKLRMFLEESISFGTLGKHGRGVTEHFNVDLIDVDLISAGLEYAVGSIGGFCVGSSFIIEHQRLSGLGYCFSASLPPLLAQAAITALDRFQDKPEMFETLRSISKKMHLKLNKLTYVKVRGNEISPVKHLYIKDEEYDRKQESMLLSKIVDLCAEHGLAVVETQYLDEVEIIHPRHSLRITCNISLSDSDLTVIYDTLELVTKLVLSSS